jgi:hypothetical protein
MSSQIILNPHFHLNSTKRTFGGRSPTVFIRVWTRQEAWEAYPPRYQEICEVLGYSMYRRDNMVVITFALDESPSKGRRKCSCQVPSERIGLRMTRNSSCCCASPAYWKSCNVYSQTV